MTGRDACATWQNVETLVTRKDACPTLHNAETVGADFSPPLAWTGSTRSGAAPPFRLPSKHSLVAADPR